MPRGPQSKGVSLEWLQESVAAARHNLSLKVWRAVEAQHVVSTLRLTGNNPEEHDLLERILEESKPPLPPEAVGLHYLLATPFRYPPPAYGSRFRSRSDPGVLYSALERRTACAEMGYWRWRFVSDSDGLLEIAAAPQTLFRAGAIGSSIDLQLPPFDQFTRLWTDPVNYDATQTLGQAARHADVALIVYRSVRDPEPGACLAVLRPSALHPKRPIAQETWYLTVTSDGAIWQRERERFLFRYR
jgi:hypothetical protein